MNKLIKDGKVAVLYSPGFGAGWSTWTSEHASEMVFDAELAQAVLDGRPYEDRTAIAERKWPGVYTGELAALTVEWVSVGTRFRIHEYDGAESVVLFNEEQWFIA